MASHHVNRPARAPVQRLVGRPPLTLVFRSLTPQPVALRVSLHSPAPTLLPTLPLWPPCGNARALARARAVGPCAAPWRCRDGGPARAAARPALPLRLATAASTAAPSRVRQSPALGWAWARRLALRLARAARSQLRSQEVEAKPTQPLARDASLISGCATGAQRPRSAGARTALNETARTALRGLRCNALLGGLLHQILTQPLQ